MAHELATFAGGCFWCMVAPFAGHPGVNKVVSGYTGGRTENPTYEAVCRGDTGHCEAVQITYDPAIVSYETRWSRARSIPPIPGCSHRGPRI